MSLWNMEDVWCPKCGTTKSMPIWQSLNASLDPQAKENLLNEEINLFVCDQCGHKSRCITPLLYHDMDRRFMVQYIPLQAVYESEDLSDMFTPDGQLRWEETEEEAASSQRSKLILENISRLSEPLCPQQNIENTREKQNLMRISQDYLKKPPHIVFGMDELVRYILFRDRLHELFEGKGGKGN